MGSSSSGGKSKSKSSTRNSQDVWGPQGEALDDMYGQMSNLWNQSSGLGPILQNLAGGLGGFNQNLMQGGMGGYNNMLGGGSFGDTSDVRSALMDSLQQTSAGSNMGRMYGDIVGGQGNTYIDPLVDTMKQSGMDNLNRMQSNAGLDASRHGQSGSSRHAMQNAMLGAQANKDMLGQEYALREGNYARDMDWKMQIARQADQGIQNTQNTYMNMLGGANNSVNSGMGYGAGLQNLGMGSMAPYMQAYQAPWQMGGQYSNILGSPTVLGSGSGSSNSKSVQGGKSSGKS